MNYEEFAWSTLNQLPLRRKTVSNYRSAFKCHLLGSLGHIEIEDISRHDIQQVLHGLTPQTAAIVLAVSKTLFREAFNQGIIESMPTATIRTPQVSASPRKFMTIHELIPTDLGKYRYQILFLAFHGLRWGEAVALEDSDIYEGKVHVNKSIHGPTKTRAGVRQVPLVSEFRKFPATPKGIRAICHQNGIHIHSLRHTYAYLLKQSGVHVTTAQKLLGHSDPKITLGIYTGFRTEEIVEAGNLIREFSKAP